MDSPAPTTDDAPRPERKCPSCGGARLRRTPRRSEDRQSSTAASLRRYRCCAASCDWSGLLPRSGSAQARWRQARRGWARRWPVWVAASALVVTAAAAAVAALWRPADLDHRALRLPPGDSYAGMSLTPSHRLLKLVSQRSDDELALPASAPALAKARAPLHLRQFCAWGEPGRDPYRGTPEQALALAQLPPEVVKRISADIQAGRHTDQLTITNAAIRADRSGREFDPKQIAMSFGQTLCLDTRVNFKTDHAERAELYEAAANNGRVYAVMVPRVCGNVSVLGQRGERVRRSLDGVLATADKDDPSLRLLPDALITADDDGRSQLQGARRVMDVPEPGTLLMALSALALALAIKRRR